MSDRVEFTFNWLAMQLLGRGLYSNPWNALSELVANGLDAKADTVWIYIDNHDKANATVEIIDNGTGMSRNDITTYAKVGYNKRRDNSITANDQVEQPMGRKGIGKLAALYLSHKFFISTKHEEGSSIWQFDATGDEIDDESRPELTSVTESTKTLNDELWESLEHGTRITLLNVDLTGYGTQSMNSLGSKLANQFLLDDTTGRSIQFCLNSDAKQMTAEYDRVKKAVAFKNLAEVSCQYADKASTPSELSPLHSVVEIPFVGLPGDSYRHKPGISGFPTSPEDSLEADEKKLLDKYVDWENRTYKAKPFELEGWIGIHATIQKKAAQKNDERFEKNKFYNPAQIRLYVRGKLASEHLLSRLGLTGTYANYIEGEISFDILDHDELDDIATSNRQDFDETDARVILLKALVRPITRDLIRRRTEIATRMQAIKDKNDENRDAEAKKHFSELVGKDLKQIKNLDDTTRRELQTTITNKVQGDIHAKSQFRVFISHASKDKLFASMIDDILTDHGATKEEVFFTSREGDTTLEQTREALSKLIKESIVDSNTLVFYVTSKNFNQSTYCLFEAGAGWATRGVHELRKLNVEYATIPDFLRGGLPEVSLAHNRAISLDTKLHNYLIDILLNPMIDHLNRGREINNEELISRIERKNPPGKIELKRLNKSDSDFYHPEIVNYWADFIDPNLNDYIDNYPWEDEDK